MSTDLKELIRDAEASGFRVKMTRKNHYQFLAPNNGGIVTTSGTPSDSRTYKNARARLRRIGLNDR